MTITVRELNATGTIIFQTTASVNGRPPTIFFKQGSFARNPAPDWVTNKANGRTGNYKHFNGTDDEAIKIIIVLLGSNRKVNLQTIRAIENQVIYIDDGDLDSNNNGSYVVLGKPTITYRESIGKMEYSANLEQYNN